jgi:hypothetical protein
VAATIIAMIRVSIGFPSRPTTMSTFLQEYQGYRQTDSAALNTEHTLLLVER